MEHSDVIVVGAGFSGLYTLKKLRDQGLSVVVLEAGSDVGGTWYWNRYPGLRCDIESMTYSYSFDDELEQEWAWTERYATHTEILNYVQHVADRFELRDHIRFNERVIGAEYEESTSHWTLRIADGKVYRAPICVMATGCLSVPNLPDFEGLDEFQGDWYHTAAWPDTEVSFDGKRVAVVGTGSSGTQAIPVIAQTAEHLTVLQRTPNYSIPARNRSLTEAEVSDWKAHASEHRARARASIDGDKWERPTRSALSVTDEEREAEYERRWSYGSFGFMASYNDLFTGEEANDTAADFFRMKTAERLNDPRHIEIMTPTEYIGTKRICVDTDFYETFNRDNVDLVDLRETPLRRIDSQGLVTTEGRVDADIIVFATGYDAMTGALLRMNIRGRNGRSLNDDWADGPRSYLGLGMAGYPNLFTVTGPYSPSVLTNLMTALEQHVEWITDCIAYLHHNGIATIEASEAAEIDWMEHAASVAAQTLYPRANSWFRGANIEGKPRVLMPYAGDFAEYGRIIDDVATNDYRGFELTAAAPQPAHITV